MHKADRTSQADPSIDDGRERALQRFLGIDISKAEFYAALLDADRLEVKSFPNNRGGFKQLSTWLRKSKSPVHGCMEATGAYWEALANYLHGEGIAVSVINPAQIKAFAGSELLRVKTDSVDAALIARFCRSHRPGPWTPPAAGVRGLQELVRRLEALKADRGQQLNRWEDRNPDPELVAIIKSFDRAIVATERTIKDCIREHPSMKAQCHLLCSIPGVGERTASVLLAEVFLRADFASTKQVVAYAGLAPRIKQSGTSLHKGGICKAGNWRVRKCLFFPAIVAGGCNPLLRSFATRLAARGKAKMSVVGALMRKLLVLCYGVLKSGQAFGVTKVA